MNHSRTYQGTYSELVCGSCGSWALVPGVPSHRLCYKCLGVTEINDDNVGVEIIQVCDRCKQKITTVLVDTEEGDAEAEQGHDDSCPYNKHG